MLILVGVRPFIKWHTVYLVYCEIPNKAGGLLVLYMKRRLSVTNLSSENDLQRLFVLNSNVCSHFFTFALMTTGAFSQNVGKLFSELKLVTDNLSSFMQKPTEKPLKGTIIYVVQYGTTCTCHMHGTFSTA